MYIYIYKYPRRQQIGNNFLNAPLWRLRSTRPSTHTKATLRPTDYKPPHSRLRST